MSTPNLAIFADFENVAIGVRDAKYDKFDVSLVLERLLDKGKIVVKKAYADWDRYKADRRPLHEAAFELIEIPHVSYSGKNSADIRMVVDALDLCYTKEHVQVFVIVSGDSDFSPLVSKLRENDKTVIGVGVKNSSSDLLIENCDEFIYYDELVQKKDGRGRRKKSSGGARKSKKAAARTEKPAEGEGDPQEAFALVIDQVEALLAERDQPPHASMVKQTLKRKRPNFSEGYYGFRTFNDLVEEAERRGLLVLTKDQKGGGYVVEGLGEEA
ncbi:MAG: NYN domain-containing protein [Deltaproteobacteria bacterium]|nr:NYN domain-containing protein [Deltaproteobacteria bacterium]